MTSKRDARDTSQPATPSEDQGGSRLRRGLAIGALVAVAVAGSTILQRRRVRERIRRELWDDAD